MDHLKKYAVHLAALVVFFFCAFIHFQPAFQGKKLQQSDTLQWKGMAQEAKAYEEKTGESTLWTNSMFGGMPTYYIWFKQANGPIDYVRKILSLGFTNEVGKFMTGMILFYILLLLLKVNAWLAMFMALAFAFGTNNLVLLNAGHNTKIATLMASPLIIAGVLLAYRSKYLLGTIVFTLGMSINLKSQHPQMTYYLGLVLMIYVLAVFINKIKSGELVDFVKASGFLVIGLLLAVGTTANKTLPIYEYSKDTMRGAPILQQTSGNGSSSEVDGLAWDYAMNWSNGSEDLLQSWIPLANGGSTSEPLDSDSGFAKVLRKNNIPSRSIRPPMYWGSLPFTSGPIYFGAIIFFLFFIALFTYKDTIKWWVLSAAVLTFLLSMGKNFEFLNRLFFEYFPYYNKFRTPNSILSVTAIIIPLLAALGLQSLVNLKELPLKKTLIAGGGFILFTVFIGFVGPGIFDLSSSGDARLAQNGFDIDVLIDDRASMLRSSALRSAFLMSICLAAIWAYAKGYINKIILFVIVGVFSFGDLYLTNLRYVSSDNYVSERRYQANYTPRQVDKQILSDPDPHYRVLDSSANTFNSSFASYFHKSIGGYHAAKLQRFQDIIDYHIVKNNNKVLNMLNTKYVISGSPQKEQVGLNSAALGNAWFVNSVKFVNTPDEEIQMLNDFDPLGEAIVHKEFKGALKPGTQYDKSGSTINLSEYKPNKLTYAVNANGNQLAVFSEVWYGPDKGWNAYIDGQAVDHIRANYILRALEIPSGQHTVVFEFEPKSNKTGRLISMISSLIFLLLSGYYFWTEYKRIKA
jgi:hypothetical protein